MFRAFCIGGMSLLFATVSLSAAEIDDSVNKLVARIKSVSNEGKGNQDASVAWKELIQLGPDALLPILASMKEIKPIPENWLRTAIDAIVEKEKQAKRSLPADKLEAFVKDLKNPSPGRRLAYELLTAQDPKTPDQLLPSMLDDPNSDLRRDAIAAALAKIDKTSPKRVEAYQSLFSFTRDEDQAQQIAKELAKDEVYVDLLGHFNVITKWMVVGPFDSPKGAGYKKPFPPEEKVDLSATYTGKGGKSIQWKRWMSFDKDGVVELNNALGKHKDAVAYAYTEIESETERPVELRFGSIVSLELFLNGKKLFEHEEYHHGQRFDQYMAKGTLKKGKNYLLVKVLQNNQSEPWAQTWTFQVRICDETGGKVPFKQIVPTFSTK